MLRSAASVACASQTSCAFTASSIRPVHIPASANTGFHTSGYSLLIEPGTSAPTPCARGRAGRPPGGLPGGPGGRPPGGGGGGGADTSGCRQPAVAPPRAGREGEFSFAPESSPMGELSIIFEATPPPTGGPLRQGKP